MKKIGLLVVLGLIVSFGMFGANEIFGLAGNVGIGTSTPRTKLDVYGDMTLQDTKSFYFSDGTVNQVRMFSDGTSGTGGRNFSIQVKPNDGSGNGIAGNPYVNILHYSFGTNATSFMTGNVGIGTSNPQVKLDVIGSAFRLTEAENQPYFEIAHYMGTGAYGASVSNSAGGARMFSLRARSLTHSGGGSGLHDIIRFDGWNLLLVPDNNGRVSIGTAAFSDRHKLTVKGGIASDSFEALYVAIGSKEQPGELTVTGNVITDDIIVNTDHYADFVFEEGYDLPELEEVEAFIEENGHLPEIPSEAEALSKGISLTDMNVKLLQKVEELTLYLIEQNKQLQGQAEKIAELEAKLAE